MRQQGFSDMQQQEKIKANAIAQIPSTQTEFETFIKFSCVEYF